MGKNIISELTSSAVKDILSFLNITIPVESIQKLWNNFQKSKEEQARDILQDEIEQGNFNNIAVDEKLSIIHRYILSAKNGNARINLRLLAQLISGLMNGEKLTKGLYASEFNRYSSQLESLSYEEIQVLALLAKCREDAIQEVQEPAYLNAQVRVYQRSNEHYFLRARSQFDNPKEFNSLVLALQRTGFIASGQGQTVGIYELSPFFDKITQLIDFQEALKKEPE